MIIKHKILGDLDLEISKSNVIVNYKDKEITGKLVKYGNSRGIKFEQSHTFNNCRTRGIQISDVEYLKILEKQAKL